MKAKCPCCGRTENLGARVFGKLGLGAGATLLGVSAMKKNPLLGALFAAGGALLGHALDTHVLPNCPSCRVALKAVNTVL